MRGRADHESPAVRASDWAIVLAAGSGTRLGALTVDRDGAVVAKQFCSLRGGRSLLLDAIGRAGQLVPRQRIVVVVAAEHERWWRPQVSGLDPGNVVVQPQNRGTAAGVLLPLARVLELDANASVAVLPSDHAVEDPTVLTQAMRHALAACAVDTDKLVLLGMTPDSSDTEYGWIVPGARRRDDGLFEVGEFVEKPDLARAWALLQQGAVWNSFLFAGRARTLWTLSERFARDAATRIARAFRCAGDERARALAAAYADLPSTDFSRSVLQGSPDRQVLLRVGECGWTDLGTPDRVAERVARLDAERRPIRAQWFPTVDLARAVAARRRIDLRTA